MILNMTRALLFLSAALFLAPPQAEANMAIPLLFWSLPLMVVALIPVIAIESYVLWAFLGTSAAYSILVVDSANVVSSIVGVPLSWILVLSLGILPGMTSAIATLMSYPNHSLLRITVSICALLFVCFFLSWFIEGWVAGLFLGEISTEQLDAAVFAGNAVTYSALVAFVVGFSFFSWLDERSSAPSSIAGSEIPLIAEEPKSEEWNEANALEKSEKFLAEENEIQAPSLAVSEEVNGAPELLDGDRSDQSPREREPAEIVIDALY